MKFLFFCLFVPAVVGFGVLPRRSRSFEATTSSLVRASSTAEVEDEVVNETPSPVPFAAPVPSPLMEKDFALTNLLRIAAATGRGEFANKSQKNRCMSYIETLEEMNATATANITVSPMITGTWDLVYSNTQLFRSSPFFMAGRAVCSTKEQAEQYDWFCDMHRAALAISNIGSVRQIISRTRMVSEFEVKVGAVPFLSDLTPFRYSGGLPVTIDGAIVSSAELTSKGSAWEIFMDTVEIKGSNLPVLRQVLDRGLKLESRELGSLLERTLPNYANPKPLFETTYLDDNTRISRDQDGNVFVYSKVSDSTAATDYSGTLPDLGILRLLEGFNDAVAKIYL